MPRHLLPWRSFPAVDALRSFRSSLDLLGVPFVFTQTELLDADGFCRAARARGVNLDEAQLELLHRRRLLVPLFMIHSRPIAGPAPSGPELSSPPSTRIAVVATAASEGRISDPARRRFRPWPRGRHVGPLYSHYQLLTLRSVGWTLHAASASRVDGRILYELDRPDSWHQDMLDRARSLAVVLEALSTRYLHHVTSEIRGTDAGLLAFIDRAQPDVEQDFIGEAIVPHLMTQAEALLASASTFDPLGRFHRVVRVAHPRTWRDLRFDALLAVEHRIAAEMLLLYLEDLIELGVAASIPPPSTTVHEPRHDRLRVEVRERAESVLDFGLGRRPSLVLAVEGDTEVRVAGRVLELFGVDPSDELIRVVNLRGINSDVQLLARLVGLPPLDPDGFRGARVLAPLTSLVVAVDGESGFATPQQCAQKTRAMIDSVLADQPTSLRHDGVRRDLEYMIRVRTWGPTCFECAHFSDHELAAAARAVADGTAPPLTQVRSDIAACRERNGNLKSVWRGWPVRPSKVDLADQLWETLERRLRQPSPRRPVPIKAIVEEAIDLALETRRVRELGPLDRTE